MFKLGIAMVQCTPIIGIDMWEHAYLFRFEGNKGAYVDKFWEFVDWGKVSEVFEKFNLNGKVGTILE